MSVQHTPGRWVFHEQGDADEYCLITADGKWVIAFRQNGELLKPTQLSNARLMAAAPELLEALEGLIAFAEAVETKMLVGDEGCVWAVEEARAAVAKARGEA